MPDFSLSSFSLIKRLLSSSSLSATRVVSSAYLRLLMFSWQSWFQLVIHPAWHTLHIVEINGDNVQPCHTPFLILNQFFVPCPVQTVASWPAYRFLRMQVMGSGIPISLRIFHSLLRNPHSQRLSPCQWGRSRCFSEFLLLSLWSWECWQPDLWFLCLFKI